MLFTNSTLMINDLIKCLCPLCMCNVIWLIKPSETAEAYSCIVTMSLSTFSQEVNMVNPLSNIASIETCMSALEFGYHYLNYFIVT